MLARLTPFAAAAALLVAGSPARAADPPPTAADKVPADVDYFRSTLRMGETVKTLAGTRAWKQIWTDPDVEQGWQKLVAQYVAGEGGFGPIKQFLADPANAELPGLLADVFSNEVFLYVGPGAGDAVTLFRDVVGSAGPSATLLQGPNPADADRVRARFVLGALTESADRIKGPDLVIGFKLTEPDKVAAQLQRLDPLVADALKETPLAGRSKRVKVGDDSFLTVQVDGSLVPWDMLPLAQFEEKEGEFAPLVDRLKKLKFNVAVGVRAGYLLIGFGGTADHLARFGGDGPKLSGRPELKPLAKLAGKPVTAVGYASQKLLASVATKPQDITGYADLVKNGLTNLELPEADRQAIAADVDELAKGYAAGLKTPGAQAEFSVRTKSGWETFAYDYTERPAGEGRPLTLSQHLGGDPLLAVVWRSGTTVEDYRTLVKWVTRFAAHGEKVLKEKAPGEADKFLLVKAQFLPLLKEWSDTTEKLWLPALADGQQAVVVDAKWTSKQWHPAMPATGKPLPLPEFAVVVGVSDPAKLEQAAEAYWAVGDKLIDKVREMAPNEVPPDLRMPKPKVERKGGRTLARWPLPAELGLDRQFEPTAGVGPTAAAVGLSAGHVGRLLDPKPLKTGLAPLADAARPLDSLAYFNWAGMVDAAGPWVDFATAPDGPGGAANPEAARIARKAAGWLKLFRAYGSATYAENGATVTHSEAVFGDIGDQ